jgi:epoxyqueuosine reductase
VLKQESPLHFIDIEQVQAVAAALGFARLGFARVDDAAMVGYAQGLSAWLKEGCHGDMDYMESRFEQRRHPELLLEDVNTVLMVSLDYRPSDPQWQEQAWSQLDDPQEAYVSVYARGRDYHKIIRHRLQKLADQLCERFGPFSYRAFTDSAPVMELPLAAQAGLGWRGKHTLLIHPQQGSMFFIGSLFTSLALPDAPRVDEHCGTCNQCIDVCPTQAITAPHRLDARRCISYLTIEHRGPIPLEFRRAIGNRIYGCDDCQLICPWNKFAKAPLHAQVGQELAPRHALGSANLAQLWAWSETDFLSRTEGSAIRRIGYWRWRRNLVIAMGNALYAARIKVEQGLGQKPEGVDATQALRQSLLEAQGQTYFSTDAILSEHLAWALAAEDAVLV